MKLPITVNVQSDAHTDRHVMPVDSTYPPLEVELVDGEGETIDLSQAVQAMLTLKTRGETVIDNRLATVTDRDTIEYQWKPQDVDEAGYFNGTFTVMLADGRELKAPSKSTFTVEIRE